MIQHIVMLDLRDDHDPSTLAEVMHGLAGLVEQLPGFVAFEHGPNRDFEDKSAQYPYGFVGSFADAGAVTRYAADPRHQALGGRLMALCNGGEAGIMVVDLDTGAPR